MSKLTDKRVALNLGWSRSDDGYYNRKVAPRFVPKFTTSTDAITDEIDDLDWLYSIHKIDENRFVGKVWEKDVDESHGEVGQDETASLALCRASIAYMDYLSKKIDLVGNS